MSTISTPEQQNAGGGLWDRFTAPTEPIRRPFRRWRRGRPFFPGLFVALAGADIYYWPHSSLGKQLSMGMPGISSVFISVFLLIFAVTIWFFPTYRVFSGIAAIMLALLALVATNLGGFLIGTLFGMFGGAFAVAWTPRAEYTVETRRQRRHRIAAEGLTEAEVAAAAATAERSAARSADTEQIQTAETVVPAWGTSWAAPQATAQQTPQPSEAATAAAPAASKPEIPGQSDAASAPDAGTGAGAVSDAPSAAGVSDAGAHADAADASDADAAAAEEEAANIAIIEQAARAEDSAPINPEPSVKED